MSLERAGFLNRLLAKTIDLLFVFILAAILPRVIGPMIGFLYSLLADGMHLKLRKGAVEFSGQSLGKKLCGLRVLNAITHKPASFKDSAIRNSPIGLATFFAIIPLWGWIILALIGIPLMAMEIYLMKRVETGHRLGDVMADTEVVKA